MLGRSCPPDSGGMAALFNLGDIHRMEGGEKMREAAEVGEGNR